MLKNLIETAARVFLGFFAGYYGAMAIQHHDWLRLVLCVVLFLMAVTFVTRAD